MTPKLKNLPIGVSTFESIIKSDNLYVDKTEHIYNLLKPNSRYFFSRPRRFGKSLTCSTLDAIFSGKKELFKNLWIGRESDYTFEKHPVIYLDMSEMSYDTPEDLRESLHEKLDYIAKSYGIEVESKLFKTKLNNLVIKLYEKFGPVVVIIDEYDKPIIEHVDHLNVADKIRTILRGLYGAFKGNSLDKHLHFLFITGVSKFAKVSLFSEVNNLKDLTTDEQCAAIVGYTQQEVETYLKEYIQALAEKEKTTYRLTLEKLKIWYNGFRFSESQVTVYNPFSLHNCLSSQKFSNYWFTSGTPTVLMKIITKNPKIVTDFITQEIIKIAESGMEDFSIEVYYKKIVTLLLQTGYLTIKSYDPFSRNYTLDYPNLEVRYSMTEQIIDYIAQIPKETLGEFYARFTKALMADNIDEYCAAFRDYLKLIPHNIIIDREKFFQATFYNTALLIDPRVILSESATDRGYIDIVLHGATHVFVMEFKKDKTPEAALKQILEKKYYEKYVLQGDHVTLVGINFNVSAKKRGKRSGVDVAWVTQEK